ncbi:HAD family hydrolase [Brucella pituitosa]|uniref:HAD family hydrolase n=1 Tax=Brucella pituitosa TaxID=571256 RepID=UPI0009A1B369|nr:HAD family phosphatase [Brucella pituitosa]
MSACAVLFDMDGTLVDSEPFHYETLLEAIAAFSGVVPDNFEKRITGTTIADCHAMLRDETGFTADLDTFVKAKYAAYVSGAIRLKLRPGATEVLAYLDKAGIPYAIVSNSDRMLMDANLRAVGLQRPDFISVSRNDVREGKPSAEPYLRGAYLFGVEPSQCIVVEDSVPGAHSGLAAGMTVIGWPEPHRTDLIFPNGVLIADPENLLSSLQPLLSAVAQ